MRLTKLFMLTTGLLLTLVAMMLARNLMQEWRAWRASTDGLEAMAIAYQAMQVAEKASFERGPTNGVLGDGDVPDPAKRERLEKARDATDAAFRRVLISLKGAEQPDLKAAYTRLRDAELMLVAARVQVARIAALPRAARQRGEVMNAVNDMFRVIDVVMEGVTLLSGHAERIHPELTDSLVAARLAAELREYAGRLGSQFTAALTENKPLGPAELRNIPLLQGRIFQLWRLIEVRSTGSDTDPRLSAAIAETRAHYFNAGLRLVDEVQALSVAGKPYGMDTAGFAARYVPEMGSIVKLRDAMVEVASENGRANHAAAERNLIWNATIGVTVLCIELAVFLLIRRRVLKPLLVATASLGHLSRGQLDVELPAAKRHDEIGDMQDALRILRDVSVDKRRLEHEHERLIGELQTAARIDFLTGLFNRRAFSEAANQHLATARRQDWPLTLILLDIDRFKAVNDTYGHDIGDIVLQEVAAIAKRTFREADAVARFGGEEFIALAVDCGLEDAGVLVERLRGAIQSHVFRIPGGRSFSVTASFGMLLVPAKESPDLDALFTKVDRALYAAKRDGRNRVEIA